MGTGDQSSMVNSARGLGVSVIYAETRKFDLLRLKGGKRLVQCYSSDTASSFLASDAMGMLDIPSALPILSNFHPEVMRSS